MFTRKSAYSLCVVWIWFAVLAPLKTEAQSHSEPPVSIEELQRHFQNPPDDARIMMRWWWFGPSVTKPEIERELRTMKEGGIGGVEVQPVYPLALDDPQHGTRNLPYLSDEFLDALRFASEKAKELGIRFDLTLGSGWPYGGSQVPISDAAGCLRVERIKISGGSQRVPLPDMVDGEKLLAVFLVPTKTGAAPEEYPALTEVRDGSVFVPADTNEAREVLVFIVSRTGMMVKRAAVAAEGFVVNHYDQTAIEHYLHNVGDRLMQAFTVDRPYAVFCDSLEVYGSDWTDDFLQEFQKRKGYDLRPYLPALVNDVGPKTQAIRHDWGETLTELFNERFASTVHAWAKHNGTKFRMQGYGTPPAELSSSALADLPEGEGAEWKRLAATRWASSASHIYGVPVTSSETWTWLHSPVFRATPLDMKAEADRHFLQGINQLIGHGWPYTPENVDYPGWRFYAAAVFDEKNPWWIVMPDVTKYLQRISYMLRQGEPANDVALYLPTNDGWAHFRPGHVDLFQILQEQIGLAAISGILESGFDFDFFDDDALRRVGRIENNSLVLGSNHYRVIVLPNVERIPLETYRKLEEFVRAGGILVATHRLPAVAPGFRASDADQAQISEITERLFRASSAPARFVENDRGVGNALRNAMAADISLSPAAPEIGFLHRRLPDAEIYFLANTGNTPQTTTATFRVSGLQPEWLDPMSGTVAGAQVKARSAKDVSISLNLPAYASRLLIFSRNGSSTVEQEPSTSTVLDLSEGWRVTFDKVGSKNMEQLGSWTDDLDTRYFSGQATYEKTITVPSASLRRDTVLRLDFGEGNSLTPQPLKAGMQAWLDAPIREAALVFVNGTRAGSLWCPPYSLDITGLIHAGENSVKVVVANLALNYMAGHALPNYRLLNLRYGVRFEAQDMDKVQPVPAGLFGPIRLVAFREKPSRRTNSSKKEQ